ncbi:hypothetical protein Dfri01_65910 [Dyadobacter frigoris]|uniref:hypothetical protein n=1 Tax=Dyadobacter frigoris TaxID=2576211 RepID=UPI0024A2B29A|nr:hypothetical protein [Dyadobacter frigoris]GLU57130.1 hypothetical protein Dfri01_65910 [Dyadobacter frigoris]
MNDSGFESSSIRQLLLKFTGINILSIKTIGDNISNQDENPLLLIHFTSNNYSEKVYEMTISKSALNKLCEADMTVFKDYFEKFASTQVI